MCYTPRIILVFTARKSRLVAPVDCVNGSLYIVVLYGKYIMQYNRFVNGAVQSCIRTWSLRNATQQRQLKATFRICVYVVIHWWWQLQLPQLQYMHVCISNNVFCRFVKMSSPNINNVMLTGCMLCYISVFFTNIGIEQAYVCTVRLSSNLLMYPSV